MTSQSIQKVDKKNTNLKELLFKYKSLIGLVLLI